MGPLIAKFDGQRPFDSEVAVDSDYSTATRAGDVALSSKDLAGALGQMAAGNDAALSIVYAATAAKLFGVVSRILGRRDLAEDVLQEVYIRIWQRAGEFDPAHGSPMTWLVTVARNRALDESRRTTTAPHDDCPLPSEVSSDEHHVADHEEQQHLLLLASLDRLPTETKEAVLLAYHYGMSREEIARRTNRPVATVQALLRQGLAQVRDGLGR